MNINRIIRYFTLFVLFLSFNFGFTQIEGQKLVPKSIYCTKNGISVQQYLEIQNANQLSANNYKGNADCERWFVYETSIQQLSPLVIELPDPLADLIEAYVISPNKEISKITVAGDEIKLTNFFIKTRNPIGIFKVAIPGKYTIIVKYVRTGKLPHLMVKIWSLPQFLAYNSRVEYFFGFLYGIFFLYFVVALFWGIKNNSKIFLIFSLWILSNISFFVLSSGHLKFYLYPNTPHLNSILRMYLMFVSGFALCEFLVNYLQIKPQTKWIRRIVTFVLLSATLCFIYLLVNPNNGIEKTQNFAVSIVQFTFLILIVIICSIPFIHFKVYKKFSYMYLVLIFNTINAIVFLIISTQNQEIDYNSTMFWLLILPMLEVTAIAVTLTDKILSSFRTTNTLLEKNLNLQLNANNIQTAAVELERKRIAVELHDDILNRLSILLMLNRSGNTTNEIVESTLSKINKDIRNYAYRLYPPWIEELTFVEMVERELKAMAASLDIEIQYHFYDLKHEFSHIQKINVFRILQEFLQNSHKHGQAKKVTIDIFERNEFIEIYIEDNGTGFDMGTMILGIGTNSVKSRINMLGGQITMNSEIGKSVSWLISFPLQFKIIEMPNF